ncbi:hypothetical protein AX15_001891 [Amanita polypyramis BW_CC]|nr:hypothetical protein AX15_001891 [Amanita polypyramis BW_CC]
MVYGIHNSFPPTPYVEGYPRRVRAYFGGKCLIDTRSGKLGWQTKYYPNYFFNADELPKENVKLVEQSKEKDIYDVEVNGKKAERSLTLFHEGGFRGLFTITQRTMDHWFEEDAEVFVHPKDPYKRVDVLQSSQHVRIEINGVEVANTRRPRFLYETMLPNRTYIPKLDFRIDLLEASDLTTRCPYKGTANYYHVVLPSQEKIENVIWWYKTPLPESVDIKGSLAFYDERVDVWIDGKLQPRPVRD